MKHKAAPAACLGSHTLVSIYCGTKSLQERVPHIQDLWLRTEEEVVWGSREKKGGARVTIGSCSHRGKGICSRVEWVKGNLEMRGERHPGQLVCLLVS